MEILYSAFQEARAIERIKHFLPAQAPLKDFIHHNTLHAFQHDHFHEGLHKASVYFGYRVYLPLAEYRAKYEQYEITEDALRFALSELRGLEYTDAWKQKLLREPYHETLHERIGRLHRTWKTTYQINMPKSVHPRLFRMVSSYLDQGISIRPFPRTGTGFLDSVRKIEKNSHVSIFSTKTAHNLLLDESLSLESLLDRLVGDDRYYAQYLFDQQFAHPGWSGIVSFIEDHPNHLIDKRIISLREWIMLELLFELDTVQAKMGDNWLPLAKKLKHVPGNMDVPVKKNEWFDVLAIWHDAMEWTQYFQPVGALLQNNAPDEKEKVRSFVAFFCIDDRECSIRRYVEQEDPHSETFGTPGFFNVAFYFQPEHAHHHTKLCPAPMPATHLIREKSNRAKMKKDLHFTKRSHALVLGWLIAQTLGFWSALKLFFSIFRPSVNRTTSYSFRHMDSQGELTIAYEGKHTKEGLQIGFKPEEMADRVEGLLKSVGMTKFNTDLLYMVGHGASSVNNTHYAGYDCGACSGRPGSVNARVFAHMANDPEVREILANRGLTIPEQVQFVGAMHDTTRDEIEYYDTKNLSADNKLKHAVNRSVFLKALRLNALERARRFELTNSHQSLLSLHEKVKQRSVSLFEPRPELNHATNYICIVGNRKLTRGLFFDRRSFLNSYDWEKDPEGTGLKNILGAATPVCGGINLEYFFSRMDPTRLGAGSKLPHNVMGLIGVANGLDGDLRPGLPQQMVEVHDPLRLLMVVEQRPDVVLRVLQQSPAILEWYQHQWIHLVCIDPQKKEALRFDGDKFVKLRLPEFTLKTTSDLGDWIKHFETNLPVLKLIEAEHV